MPLMLGGALLFQVTAASTSRADPRLPAVMLVELARLSLLGIALEQAPFLVGLRWTTPCTGATLPVFAAALSAC